MPCEPNHLMHKNLLQQYVQRSKLPLPVYHTADEGPSSVSRFKSAVTVDGITYESRNTFCTRKAAEQDAARLAMETILNMIKDEGSSQIGQDIFCKTILNEYAVKMRLPQASYNTVLSSTKLLPLFTSTVSFDGQKYVGQPGKSKKEAEQMAARVAIQSILGQSPSRGCLWEIITCKKRLYASFAEVRKCSLQSAAHKLSASEIVPTTAGVQITTSEIMPKEELSSGLEPSDIPSLNQSQDDGLSGQISAFVGGTESDETRIYTAVSDEIGGSSSQDDIGSCLVKREPIQMATHHRKKARTADVSSVVPNGVGALLESA